ncbi:MAG: hypothetical protein U0L98_04655 [Clostridia bacterium]|nr:hypothetical protein [Clostridia bacterium]
MIDFENIYKLNNLQPELKKDCVIHSNVITGNKYIINLESNYKNCIGILVEKTNNYRFKSIDLLTECSNFGKKLFELYKDDFKLYKPETFIDENNKEIEFFSLTYKDFPSIKNTRPRELLSLFIEWFTQYGSPIFPKIVGIEENTIIEFKDIMELRNRFIILYLLYSFYYNISLVCNTFSNEELSEQKRYSLNSSIKNINTLGNILFDDFSNLDTDFIEENDIVKIDYHEEIKKKLTYKINYYSSIFKTTVTQYIIYETEECSYTYISDNLFDLVWNIFLELFKSTEKITTRKICTDCGFFYTPTSNHSKFCDTCYKKHNFNKISQNQKKLSIDYIIEKSKNFKSKNKDLQNRIDEIITLNNIGNSRKRYSFSKKIIDKTKHELEEELRKIK